MTWPWSMRTGLLALELSWPAPPSWAVLGLRLSRRPATPTPRRLQVERVSTPAEGGLSPYDAGPRSWVEPGQNGWAGIGLPRQLWAPPPAGCDWLANLLGGLNVRAGVTAPERSRGQPGPLCAAHPPAWPWRACMRGGRRGLSCSDLLSWQLLSGLAWACLSCQSRGDPGVRRGIFCHPRLSTHCPAPLRSLCALGSSQQTLTWPPQPHRMALPPGGFWTPPRGPRPCLLLLWV